MSRNMQIQSVDGSAGPRIEIVGLGGSFKPGSTSNAAVEVVLAGAREAGGEVINFDLATLGLPHYQYGVTPSAVVPFIEAVRSAHAMVWCSPLYHGSISGSFKNAIDWLQLLSDDDPPYLTDKVVALVATAGGEQALQAINTMEYIVRALRGWTLPLTAPISRASQAFDKSGAPRQSQLADRLHQMGGELVRSARAFTIGSQAAHSSQAENAAANAILPAASM